MGVSVEPRLFINTENVEYIERKAIGEAVMDATSIATKNFFQLAQSHAIGAMSLRHRTEAGNIIVFDAPAVQVGIPDYGESQKVVNQTISLMLKPTAAGNDEITITVTGGGGAPAFNVAGMPLWSAAVNAGIAGTRDPIILCFGDSKTRGQAALSAAITGNVVSASYPTFLAGKTFGGIAAQWANLMATGGQIASAYAPFDNRFAVGAVAAGVGSLGSEGFGGFVLRCTNIGVFGHFTPIEQVDTLEVWYLKTSGAGVLGLGVNNGAVTNVNTANATTAFVKQTIICPLGINTLDMSLVSGVRADICQIIAYDSTARRVRVYNAGWPGAKIADVATSTNPQNPLNAFDEIDPDLTIIDFGTNEFNQASLPVEATWKAQYQNIINAAKAVNSDILLSVPFPGGAANALVNQATIRRWILDLAATNSLQVSDLYTRWGSYATKNALGWYRDTAHATYLGYTDVAAAHGAMIGAV